MTVQGSYSLDTFHLGKVLFSLFLSTLKFMEVDQDPAFIGTPVQIKKYNDTTIGPSTEYNTQQSQKSEDICYPYFHQECSYCHTYNDLSCVQRLLLYILKPTSGIII